ncbi:dTDP-4-dehydrorhamnose 3,5-epimerase [Paenibacillus sp. GP183]|uniref:dTDP-4-dehydrorhamnose 3,5-epimerase n=1 Tax=Paenibacillus sp. GP183 TaxID=1882751 RepID=UPI000899F9F4|nr:dTDP-4-dehydrorhamnose 3,5-epimerase [Paenibacillus sp. GP183]SEC12989.1 dTDP-4-dehydrorhamnose 3,5-epimerase [Paenibacillus sp. GP183]
MGQFQITKTDINGLVIIEPKVFGDHRGYFMETYNENNFKAAGVPTSYVQDNQSKSREGVLRGLHFQKKYPQGKLVRVLSGEVFDVAVDLRKDSPTYKKWHGVILTGENNKQFYVPEGFAHGFLVLSKEAVFAYKCTDFYHPEYEGGVLWNDPEINVEWPIHHLQEVLLSDKDMSLKTLAEQNL